MQIIAIIPARGGSKGIARKNIRPLGGEPLISYSIKAAQGSKWISRIIVSTDDSEIADISKKYNAEVISRPDEISGDSASSESALTHALQHLKRTENYSPDIVVFLQCTSPLTIPEDIDETIQTLLDSNADSAFTATFFHYYLWKKDKKAGATAINHDKKNRVPRQQREPQFLETGAVYVMRTEGFLKANHRFFGKTVMYITPPERRLEIDDPIDFEIAEALLQKQKQSYKIMAIPKPVAGIVFDFDGVFTDNKVIVHEDGTEAVICNRSDGHGLSMIKKLQIPLLVLSTERNPVVTRRCEKLGISCIQNVPDKIFTLKNWIQEKNLQIQNVIYVGNDINDITCMQYVGCGITVSDASAEVKKMARITLASPGGEGAIRELTDLIIRRLECLN